MTEQLRLPLTRVVELPERSLVVLVGASGSGKTTFAGRHFDAGEVVSSDVCRALVGADENDQSASDAAFALLHATVRTRLETGRLTVVDATNVKATSRAPLLALARRYDVFPVAIVIDLPERRCAERNQSRPGRNLPHYIVRAQVRALRRSLPGLPGEGFRHVHVFKSSEELDAAVVERTHPPPLRL